MGAGCKVGEFILRLELDRSNDVITTPASIIIPSTDPISSNQVLALGNLKVKEKQTVVQIKQLVFALLQENYKELCPPAAEYIRLRDGKNKIAGGPLRDERIISRCLLNLEDGRKLVVQVCK